MTPASDVVVIGSGPGGYVAAIRASQLGVKPTVAERDNVVGGRCLSYACIPAKAVLRSADILSEFRHADDFGIKLKRSAARGGLRSDWRPAREGDPDTDWWREWAVPEERHRADCR